MTFRTAITCLLLSVGAVSAQTPKSSSKTDAEIKQEII